jgi:hypothetical protein
VIFRILGLCYVNVVHSFFYHFFWYVCGLYCVVFVYLACEVGVVGSCCF